MADEVIVKIIITLDPQAIAQELGQALIDEIKERLDK